MRYALRLLNILSDLELDLHVAISDAAFRVLREEEDIKLSPHRLSLAALTGRDCPTVKFHNVADIGASIASGSVLFKGMVIVPCSMGTMAAVAQGLSQNLIQRAADVTLKEGRRLILVPRETPLSAIQIENMLKLSRAGATILPAMPGFYHRPAHINDLVDMLVMKILDQMGIDNSLVERWAHSTPEAPARVLPFERSGQG